jgi:hypothetical protein
VFQQEFGRDHEFGERFASSAPAVRSALTAALDLLLKMANELLLIRRQCFAATCLLAQFAKANRVSVSGLRAATAISLSSAIALSAAIPFSRTVTLSAALASIVGRSRIPITLGRCTSSSLGRRRTSATFARAGRSIPFGGCLFRHGSFDIGLLVFAQLFAPLLLLE